MFFTGKLQRLLPHIWNRDAFRLVKHYLHVAVFYTLLFIFLANVDGLNGSQSTEGNTQNNIDPVDPRADKPPPPPPTDSKIPQPIYFLLQLMRFLPILALPQVKC